jgi:hypothetical protein
MRDACTRYTFNFMSDTAGDSMVAAIKATSPAFSLPPAACSKVVECISNKVDSLQLPSWLSKDRAITALSRIKDASSSVFKEQLSATAQHQLTSVCSDVKEKLSSSLHAGAGLIRTFCQRIADCINSVSEPAAVELKEFSISGTTSKQPPPVISYSYPSVTYTAASEPVAAPLSGTSSDQITAGISVDCLPMSAEPPDTSSGRLKLSGCEDRDCPAESDSPAFDSSSLSKSAYRAVAASADTYEQALRDNPFVFAMQQTSLQDAVRRVLEYSTIKPPFPGQYAPPVRDGAMELVKRVAPVTSKRLAKEVCAPGASIFWAEGDATAVG